MGRVPYLLAAGFDKPIYCSGPTAKLLPLVMEDALKIGFTRSRNLIKKFLKHIGKLLRPLPYNTWHSISPAVSGFACVRPVTCWDRRFSRSNFQAVKWLSSPATSVRAAIRYFANQAAPRRPTCWYSKARTATSCIRRSEDRQKTLEAVLRRTLHDKGVTIIPAFSLGRTQSLLYEMNGIFERVQKTEGRTLMKQIDVIVDSPLASRFTEL